MKTIKYEPGCGSHISGACKEAVEMAQRESCNVEFEFNEIRIIASPDSDPEKLVRFYDEESERRHQAYISTPEYKHHQEEAERQQRERNAARKAALVEAPEHMTLRDAEAWKKSCEVNSDGYGGAVMTYAERWARLMEGQMAKGKLIAEIAEECSSLADEEGITGFMYGCAVSILSQVWIHGEALRLWHNLHTQIGTEGRAANDNGGVLNPAVLIIGQ